MGTVTTTDGIEIFYKDWGSGQPIVFSHGWPLSADDWDTQMLFFIAHGYRVIAADRRGHGRSTQTGDGHDMDHYADDLAAVIAHLDVHDAIHVGHSTGGGEVVRYIGRHGTGRVSGLITVGAVPPLMLKTPANPGGTPIKAFDDIREGLLKDKAQFYQDLSVPFYGANRPGANISQGLRDSFFTMSMTVGFKAAYDCVKAFSETDETEDLKKVDVPMLIIQGDDDQIVPIDDSGRLSAQIVKGSTLKVYPGAPHGLANTSAYRDTLNADILAFLRG